jgi:hypothetical protein
LIDAAPAVFTTIPTVVVYPLAGSSATLDREASARIATTLATQIAVGGHVRVIPPQTGVDRSTYLADARAAGANYYVTGFITPLGSGASVVEQVVSTTSGVLVFSVSNFISSYSEVVAQGDQLRQGIIDRADHGVAAMAALPPPQAAPEPEPSKGTDVNVGTIFGKKKKTPVYGLILPADARVAVLAVGGSADADARAAAGQAIAAAFARAGRTPVMASADTPSGDVCTTNKVAVQIAAWLDAPGATATNANASLRMIAYDCSGTAAFDHTATKRGAGLAAATTTAAEDAVAAYLSPKGR